MSALYCAAEESKDGLHEPHSGHGWKRREARSNPADSHVQHWQCRQGWQILHNCGEGQSKVAVFVIRGLKGSLIATMVSTISASQPTDVIETLTVVFQSWFGDESLSFEHLSTC